MDAAVGHSKREDPEQALEEALGQLAAFGRADFALLFATSHFTELASAMATRVREALGEPELLGGSTSNVITAEGEHEGDPGLGILALRGVRAKAALIAEADALAGELAVPAGLHLLLPDPKQIEKAHLRAIRGARGPLAGGGVFGEVESELNIADEAIGGGACAVARLEGLRAQVEVAHGVEPMTPFAKVTKVRRDAVLELGGIPSLVTLAAHLAANGFDEQKTSTMLIVALREPGKPTYVARPIVKVEPESNAFDVANAELVEGAELAFAWRETLAAGRALEAALSRITADPAPVRALVYFNCASRGTNLHPEPDADIRRIRAALPGVPVLGMSTAFELASGDGAAHLHMYCGVLVALRDA